jgi:hypothetical protein
MIAADVYGPEQWNNFLPPGRAMRHHPHRFGFREGVWLRPANERRPEVLAQSGRSLVHLAQMTGAAHFFFGSLAGLYVAAIAVVINTWCLITAAWLLVIGAVDET